MASQEHRRIIVAKALEVMMESRRFSCIFAICALFVFSSVSSSVLSSVLP